MNFVFTQYQQTLKQLRDRLAPGHPRYDHLLTLEQRLRENIDQALQHGDTDGLRNGRSKILHALNQLAQEELGQSFNELCGLADLRSAFNAALSADRRAQRDYRNRLAMLAKVKSFWIEGVLEKSLHGAAMIALGMEEKAGAVEYPWEMVLRRPSAPDSALPAGTRIGEVLAQTQGSLLILGEPGSGKTTMLLELARECIRQAELDPNLPIPVVFNLSSWGDGVAGTLVAVIQTVDPCPLPVVKLVESNSFKTQRSGLSRREIDWCYPTNVCVF